MQLKKKIHFDSVVAFFLLSVDKCLIFSNYYGVELHIIGGSGHMKTKKAEDAVPLGANSSAAIKGGRILYILHKMYKLFLLVAFFTAFFRHGCIFL